MSNSRYANAFKALDLACKRLEAAKQAAQQSGSPADHAAVDEAREAMWDAHEAYTAARTSNCCCG